MQKISIIIAAFNEQNTIGDILIKVDKLKEENKFFLIETIIIDDCSTDDTLSIVKKFNFVDKVITNDINSGKGYSIKMGLKAATGDYVIFQDADSEYNPLEISKFLSLIKDFSPDIILGSRFNYDQYTRSHNFYNKCGNFLITLLFNILYNTTFTDIYCCYLCFKKKLIDPEKLQTKGFEQHAEILAKCVKKSKIFYEVPINYNGRTPLEGKKIKFYHIFLVIKEIIKNKILSF
jgi:glycosyltransferase involved in cell wall biosynthesis